MEVRSLNVLCNLIKKKRKWGYYVEEIWQEQFRRSADLPHAEETIGSNFNWRVCSSDRKTSHEFAVPADMMGQIPTCSCAHFTSSLIPCAGICAVYCRLVDELFDVKNLHPRWRIDSHPLYRDALVKLNLAQHNSDNGSGSSAVADTAQSHLNMTAYQSMDYPLKRDVRYTKLNNLFKSIERAAINNRCEIWQ